MKTSKYKNPNNPTCVRGLTMIKYNAEKKRTRTSKFKHFSRKIRHAKNMHD
jgi:hypothetical protein